MLPISVAKITRPVAANVLLRERLFREIDGATARLVWLFGPPGSGKTLLAASYAGARNWPCLWLRLDSTDSDSASLIQHFSAACAVAGLVEPGRLPEINRDHLTNVSGFARIYFRTLFHLVQIPFLIVLDDVQALPSADNTHPVLNALLQEVPPVVRLLALSRDPASTLLARDLTMGVVVQIGPERLRLSLAETAELLAVRGLQLEQQALERLHGLTQGWTAGVILYALAIQGGGLTGALTGVPQSIDHYFNSEVLTSLKPATRRSLLKTAWLPVVTAQSLRRLDAADTLVATIHQLAWQALFVSEYPGIDAAYQYHPLFSQFLQAQAARQFSNAEVMALKRLSAQILEEAEEFTAAIALWIDSGSYDQAAALIVRQAPILITQARLQTLATWIRALPDELIAQQPWLNYWFGIAMLPCAPVQGREYLYAASRGFKTGGDLRGLFLSLSYLVGSYFLEHSNSKAFQELLRELDSLAGDFEQLGDINLQALVALSVWTGLFLNRPDHPDLPIWEQRLHDFFHAAVDPNTKMRMGGLLVKYYYSTGYYQKIRPIKELLQAEAGGHKLTPYGHQIFHLIALADAWTQGDVANARAIYARALAYAEESGVHVLDTFVHSYALRALLLADDLVGAKTAIERMDQVYQPNRPMEVWTSCFMKSWYSQLCGHAQQALEYALVALHAGEQIEGVHLQGLARVAACHAELDLDHLDAVGEHLQALRGLLEQGAGPLLEFQHALIQGEVQRRQGREEDRLISVKTALAVGEQHDFTQFFCANPKTLTPAVTTALRHGIAVAYASKLIRARRLAPPPDCRGLSLWPWPLQIYTLGRFVILRDGHPLTFKGKAPQRPLALLKCLLALGGESVPHQHLVDALWPDADGDNALRSFEMALHRLRKLLGVPEALRLQEGRLSFNPYLCWWDARYVEHCAAEITAQDTSTDAVLKVAAEMSRYYQGPFLSAEDIPCIAGYREHLHARVRIALLKVSTNSPGQRHPTVEDCLEKLSELDIFLPHGPNHDFRHPRRRL